MFFKSINQCLEFLIGHIDGLYRQAYLTFFAINFDNAGLDFLTDFKNVFDLLYVVVGNLRDVDESIHAVLKFDERAKGGDLGDFTLKTAID